jgi:hypothetical protein
MFASLVRAVVFLTSFVLALVVGMTAGAHADSPPVVRVEEDWELVVAEPAADADAPQVVCVISPYTGTSSVHATLELNHSTIPSFTPGGLQLQAWDNETFLTRNSAEQGEMSTDGETVTWTTKMELRSGRLHFEVNGASTTWGAFGAAGDLKLSLRSLLPDLAHYSPETSVDQSGVGFGGNRVTSLTLKEVRYYDDAGNLLSTDATDREVHVFDE